MIADKFQQVWGDAVTGDLASILALVCFFSIYLLITGALLRQLVLREGSATKKLFWAMVVCVPVLGWLFYLAFYKVPPSQHFR